jgi:hypothetical protein
MKIKIFLASLACLLVVVFITLGAIERGFIATGQIILLGLAMDTIYQVIVLKAFYPTEAAVVVTRGMGWRRSKTSASKI